MTTGLIYLVLPSLTLAAGRVTFTAPISAHLAGMTEGKTAADVTKAAFLMNMSEKRHQESVGFRPNEIKELV